MFGLITEEASVVVLVTTIVVVVPLSLPWVTLTQHDDDGDCPSIAAVAATTAFVQHRKHPRDDRTRTENRVEKEERRTETKRKREGEGETLAERKRHGRSEIQHRRRDARARSRSRKQTRVYQRCELDVRANSRGTSLTVSTVRTCHVHFALFRNINPNRSDPSYRGNLIPWGQRQRCCSVPVPVPAPRSFSPFTRTRACPYVRAIRDGVTKNLTHSLRSAATFHTFNTSARPYVESTTHTDTKHTHA